MLTGVALLIGAAAIHAAAPSGYELFSDGRVRTFKIDIAEPALSMLRKKEREYVPATVTVDGKVFKDAGVHLKGMGSFQPFDQKPSLVVKFDRYTPDQEYLGLSKIMLNNSVQDPTYLAELMATQMFREAGVPAARVTHAFVELNGRKPSLYVLIEAMNKDFLKQHFKKAGGNLYEAYLQDIDKQLDLDSGGTDNSQADRKRLLDVCRIENPLERWNKLPSVLDVDKYLSHCALEMFVAHTDGYALNRNNYRLYFDPPTKRFTMIAHGLDWGFQNTGAPMRPPYGSIITRAVINTPGGRSAYRERAAHLYTNLYRLDVFTNRVNAAVARLVSAAHDTNQAKQFEGYGRDMINRIVARRMAVSNYLAGPEPAEVRFDANGVATLGGWRTHRPDKQAGEPTMDITRSDGRTACYIKAGGEKTKASWRTDIILPSGKYRFTGDARAARVSSDPKDATIGAGLRISGGKLAEKVTGDAPWTKLACEFEVTVDGDLRTLVCELHALEGEAWFDLPSLRLARMK